MTTSTLCRPASAGFDCARAAHAIATMMTGDGTRPDASLPGRYVLRDKILFAALRVGEPIPHAVIEELSEGRGLDVVALRFDPRWVMPPVVAVGVRLSWKILYHSPFGLWLPEGAGAARLVGAESASPLQFEVSDGRIDCWAERRIEEKDSRRGCDVATARLRQMMGAR